MTGTERSSTIGFLLLGRRLLPISYGRFLRFRIFLHLLTHPARCRLRPCTFFCSPRRILTQLTFFQIGSQPVQWPVVVVPMKTNGERFNWRENIYGDGVKQGQRSTLVTFCLILLNFGSSLGEYSYAEA